MEISITLNNNLIYDKEFTKKDYLKLAGKSLLMILSIMFLNCGTLAFAESTLKQVVNKRINQGIWYTMLRLYEVMEHKNIVNAIPFIEEEVTNIIGVNIEVIKAFKEVIKGSIRV